MRKARYLLVAIAMVLGLATSACGPSGKAPTTFAEGDVGSPSNVTPPLALPGAGSDISALIYQGLVASAPDDQYLPALASSWQVESGGSKYVFQLRQGVRWADGKPLTSADVTFGYHSLATDGLASLQAEWSGITVTAVGLYAVAFDLPAPSANFLRLVTAGIMPAAAYPHGYNPLKSVGLFGTGPYQLPTLAAGATSATLVVNPWYRPRPHFRRIVFHFYSSSQAAFSALQGGDIQGLGQLSAVQATAVRHAANLRLYQAQTYTSVALLMNLQARQLYLRNLQVRQAIFDAISISQLIGKDLGGYARPAPTAVPPSVWSSISAALPPGNPLEAEKTLAQTPYGANAHKQSAVTLDLVAANEYPYTALARSLASMLTKATMTVKVQLMSPVSLVGRLESGNFDLALVAYDIGPDPDEYGLWSSTQMPPRGDNFSRLNDPFIDGYLSSGRKQLDPSVRAQIYAQFQQAMAADLPAVFLLQPQYLYAVSRQVKGVSLPVSLEPQQRFATIARWR